MGAKLKAAIAKASEKNDILIGNMSSFLTDIEAISTGNIALDTITGVGGFPRGRIIELYGPPSCGKTTTALQAAAKAQEMGLTVIYADYEQAMDPTYAESLGLDMNGELFYLYQPETFEQGINIARDLIETGEVGLFIVDSVAAMVTEKELESETGKSNFANQAKTMAQTMRQMAGLLKKTKTTAIWLNHIAEIIDSSPMGQRLAAQGVKRKTTPGGQALKFYSSIRMEYKPVGGIRGKVFDELTNDYKDDVVQSKVEVTVVKNKVAAPFKSAEVRVEFGRGFSNELSVLGILTAHNVIGSKSGVYRFSGATQPPFQKADWIRGELKVSEAMVANPEWNKALTHMAVEIISTRAKVMVVTEDIDPEVATEQQLEAAAMLDEIATPPINQASFTAPVDPVPESEEPATPAVTEAVLEV